MRRHGFEQSKEAVQEQQAAQDHEANYSMAMT
jgi:hypothetical protein